VLAGPLALALDPGGGIVGLVGQVIGALALFGAYLSVAIGLTPSIEDRTGPATQCRDPEPAGG
jgi:hypothetical protein